MVGFAHPECFVVEGVCDFGVELDGDFGGGEGAG